MPEPPSRQESRICTRLGLSAEEGAALVRALRDGASGRPAVVFTPNAPRDYEPPFPCGRAALPWQPERVRIPLEETRPGASPDYDAGLYYPLDLSSVWESSPLALVPPPAASIDLCAAPGGKTFLLHAHHAPHRHVANEVHPARRGILRGNLTRCGLGKVEVTGLRPSEWPDLNEQFDLILADAPCSGQSLPARGIKNSGALNPSLIKGNAKRQKGILLSALPLLKPGGHLLYTTCTYDPEENEKVLAYLMKRHPGLAAVEVPSLSEFRSRLCPFPAYRLLPTRGLGAGGFTCLLHLT